MDVQMDRLIAELDAVEDDLPEDALREIQRERDLAVPALIEVLRQATAQARAGETREGHAPFFALFLLTEFRAKEALPTIVEAISLPSEVVDELFGDAITSLFARLLATLADDRLDMIDSLIRDRNLDEFVRWSAATAYSHLVRDGKLPLEEAVQHLRQHLTDAIAGKDDQVANALVSELEEMFPVGGQEPIVLETIEEAFRQELVDTSFIDLDCIREATRRSEQERFKHLRPTAVEDTVEELRTWAWFSEKLPAPEPSPSPPPAYTPWFADESEAPAPVGTIVRAEPRVGRNDPCPCGSGKKFKKCCGAHD